MVRQTSAVPESTTQPNEDSPDNKDIATQLNTTSKQAAVDDTDAETHSTTVLPLDTIATPAKGKLLQQQDATTRQSTATNTSARGTRGSSSTTRFKVQNRPAQLIRNLHANYFHKQLPEPSTLESQDSAVSAAVRSIRNRLFVFGAIVSVAGCAILLGQGHFPVAAGGVANRWQGIGQFGSAVEFAYHGIFAVTCSWQWLKRMTLGSNDTRRGERDSSGTEDYDGDNTTHNSAGVTDSDPASDSSLDQVAEDGTLQEFTAISPFTSSASVSYWVLGYGLVGFLGLTPGLSVHAWSSYLWDPVLVLASLSPLMMGSFLIGLDRIMVALSEDETRHTKELNELQDRHENLMEMYRDDNLLKKNMLLETVGKEVQDAANLAIETLRQMTPTSLFPPSVSREQLSPCTLPIPITSILGLFTTMRHLQYISRNMQRLSRVMFTEYVQGIVERTSPHYHRGENKFDVGEFVQSLGDLVSADASLKGVEFVIYHSDYDLNHVPIKGSEESWRHALINLIKSIIDCARAGSTVELCLALFTINQLDKEKNKVMVSFEITYYPNPDSTSTEDDLAHLNALLASKLVKAMGGSLEIEQLEGFVKRFIVSVEVELSQTPQEDKTGNVRNLDDQRPVHPLEPVKANDVVQPSAGQERLQRLENMQTTHPVHESQQFFQQHIKTPLVSPSPLPSSPPPPRGGISGTPKVSAEPTVPELVRFSRKLAGLKVVLMAKEQSAFAVRLTGYLKAWGINVIKRTIRETSGAMSEADTGDVLVAEDSQTPTGGAKRTNSSASLSSKNSSSSGKVESPSSTIRTLNPAFIMIDDDVKALAQQIRKMQATPQSPTPPTPGTPRRPTHRRHKSVTSVQHTSIIYFTSLPTFKQARDTIMFILGTQLPGMNYSIANTLAGNNLGPGPLGPLPYILVLPKPAGPRRVLTAIHTAINVPVLDQSYSPIATAPTSPAPAIRHFSEEINPLDRDQIVYDPVLNQAFARPIPYSTQRSPGGLSPNNSLPPEQRQRRDMIRQLIDAGGNLPGAVAYPFDHANVDMMSPETPGSLQSIGSPTGIIVPGTGNQPAGIQFDPTAKPSGTFSPSLVGPAGHRRVSIGSSRLSTQSLSNNENGNAGGGGTVVIPSAINASSNHQPFALIHNQRQAENGASGAGAAGISPSNFIRLSNGQLLRPSAGRSPLGTPPAITQTSGLLFSPPTVRHSGMASPMPQRPEPAAMGMGMRNGSGSTSGSGSLMTNMSVDSPKIAHPVLPHGAIPSPSPLPTSPGALNRTSPGTPIGLIAPHGHGASPPPADMSVNRPRGPAVTPTGATAVVPSSSSALSIKRAKDSKLSKAAPSLVKSGVVERVSPLVNVLIVEDNDINQKILVKFMKQRKIKYDLANNGLEAVEKWRVGGFHLVLMDIQMPVMDGIEATREIRRLEKAQKIGVFPTDKPNSVGNSMQAALSAASASSTFSSSSVAMSGSGTTPTTPPASPFRSPVIIVALTATAESEDLRKTALLAGCNDYITKPVVLPWLERKIVDWGCMQALIDVDAWKEWKRGLEGGQSPGTPSGTSSTSGGARGAGGAAEGSSMMTAMKKTLAGVGTVTRANLKRPSISVRSIKGTKAAAAAAAAAKNAEAKSAEANVAPPAGSSGAAAAKAVASDSTQVATEPNKES
ncbi:ssk1 response regulator receiver [Mortierella claussenii]|nr:ssk1 response regulator receiver [Mortierella claussenii]